jgi:superfamily I DNA/RNA helicase
MQQRKLLLGPPGTGKTTRLLQEVDARLSKGMSPERIAFVSFTRAAVKVARSRAMDQFNLPDDAFPFFRTLHSLCYHQLGLHRTDVIIYDSRMELSDITGEELTGHYDMSAPTLGERGDSLLFLDQFSRNVGLTLEEAWQAHGSVIDWFRLKRFVDAYTAMRKDKNEIDFTDMLLSYASSGKPVDVDCVFIDEAQDLSSSQWRVVQRAFSNTAELIVCGDDDQCIFTWAGADVRALLEFKGNREVLAQSYRLPRAIFDLAATVASRITRRHPKLFYPADRPGTVEWLRRPEEVDLGSGTWLLLARTRRQLAGLVTLARDQGVVYLSGGVSSVDPAHVAAIQEHEALRQMNPEMPIWHDALTDIPLADREYLVACRRRGESLTKVPRVSISTVHGAKGAEADSVLLLCDLNERVLRGMDLDPDAEMRVLYVGVTRARENLFLVEPKQTRRGWQI